jgi:exodeoxyribonuclease VII small subunit
MSRPPLDPPVTDAVTEPASYEQALAELDQIVSRMESGQLPLDQLLDGYRRGAELLGWCRQRLQSVEEQAQGMAPRMTPAPRCPAVGALRGVEAAR